MDNERKRIRYATRPDGSKASLHIYNVPEGGQVRTVINSDSVTGSVVVVRHTGEEPIYQITATSEHKLKIKLKEALLILGVDFSEETRGSIWAIVLKVIHHGKVRGI